MPDIRPDPWNDFRTLTSARIALGRAGGSVPTAEVLDFGLSHARARDAVLAPFDAPRLCDDLQSAGLATMTVQSQATDRDEYLRRPDLGRRLSDKSRQELTNLGLALSNVDLVLIVSDGLSARAAQLHAVDLIAPLHQRLREAGWSIAPIIVADFARVALEDEIGELLNAKLALIILGERPGLGSANSLGAYFMHEPRIGRTDADRNCVSNIRPGGLTPAAAIETLTYLLNASRHRKLSGFQLKDERLLEVCVSR